MSSVKGALGICIGLIERDLAKYVENESDRAFDMAEAQCLQRYLTALSGAYRAAAGQDLEDTGKLKEISDEALENEILERNSND